MSSSSRHEPSTIERTTRRRRRRPSVRKTFSQWGSTLLFALEKLKEQKISFDGLKEKYEEKRRRGGGCLVKFFFKVRPRLEFPFSSLG